MLYAIKKEKKRERDREVKRRVVREKKKGNRLNASQPSKGDNKREREDTQRVLERER